MKRVLILLGFIAAAAGGLLLGMRLRPEPASAAASAAASTAAPAADLSGTYAAKFQNALAPDPPLLPEALALHKSRKSADDPLARCKPPGVPRIMNMAFPFEIVQTPRIVYILFEYDQLARRIYINGTHPEELDPTWLGYSIGRWEGDALVVETIGFNDVTWLDMAMHPHSTKLRVIERFTRSADKKTLTQEVTIDDPGMYSQPWKAQTKQYAHAPDLQLQEFICEPENPLTGAPAAP